MEEKLKKIAFSKSLRGYACDEVDTYLAYINDKYEQRDRECRELRRQMALIAAKMNEYTEGIHKSAQAENAQKRTAQQTCDAMIDEAKRQAAHILADAEAEAEVIRRRAEDNAQTIAANAAREGAKVVNDAVRSVAARSNAADRLVEEIDSFREEVYALYTRHIAELDRLAQRTNVFYDRKTVVAESAMEGDDVPVPPPSQPEPAASPADNAPNDPPIRIDWKNRTARPARDIVIDLEEESDAAAEDASGMEAPDPEALTAEDLPAAADGTASGSSADEDLDALFRSLTGKKMLTPDPGAAQRSGLPYDFDADYEDPAPDTCTGTPDTRTGITSDDDACADADEYASSGGDAYSEEYEDPAAGYEDPADDDENDGYEETDEPDETEDDTDWLLNNLKAQYAPGPAERTQDTTGDPQSGSAGEQSLDALLASGEATKPARDISLTGEFERIYGAGQTEKYVEEVEKQPLVAPEKPKNPKKHTRF